MYLNSLSKWKSKWSTAHTQNHMSNKLCFTLRAGVYPSTSQLNRDITAWKVNMAGQRGQQVKRHFNHCSLSHVMMETYPQALCYRCNLFTYIMHTLQTSLEATITRNVHKLKHNINTGQKFICCIENQININHANRHVIFTLLCN